MAESQRSVANRALAQARRMNAPAILQKALIEAGLVESNLQHQKYERVGSGDRDSVGFLQQRPSAGWGPAGQSIEQDTAQFIRAGQKVLSSGFKGSSGQLAQAIQRSAFPARYMQRAGEAEQFLRGAASSGGSTPGASRGSGVSSGGSTRTVTTTTPGVDNRAARASLIQSFLGDQNSDPLDFAMQARQLQDIPGTTTTKTVRIPGAATSSGGGAPSAGGSSDLAAMATQRANTIDAKHMPYQWGGGHGGRIGDVSKATPLDCSGAVSAVLGIDPRVSGQFTKWGRPGDGGGKGVTIYANGHHVLMKINGHFFGTSGSNPGGGAGWIPQGAISSDYLKGFTVRHSNR